MKIQDVIFFAVLAMLIYIRNIKLIIVIGLICLILAVPLFAFWIFFTAQRLVMYAAGFLAISAIWQIGQMRQTGKGKKNL